MKMISGVQEVVQVITSLFECVKKENNDMISYTKDLRKEPNDFISDLKEKPINDADNQKIILKPTRKELAHRILYAT